MFLCSGDSRWNSSWWRCCARAGSNLSGDAQLQKVQSAGIQNQARMKVNLSFWAKTRYSMMHPFTLVVIAVLHFNLKFKGFRVSFLRRCRSDILGSILSTMPRNQTLLSDVARQGINSVVQTNWDTQAKKENWHSSFAFSLSSWNLRERESLEERRKQKEKSLLLKAT